MIRLAAIRRWQVADQGSLTAFAVTFMTALIVLAGLTLDGGLALAARTRAVGQAESAARAGAQAIDVATFRETGDLRLDPDLAISQARTYLLGAGATGDVTVDGNAVTVTVSDTYPTQMLGLIGISSIAVRGSASARPVSGTNNAVP